MTNGIEPAGSGELEVRNRAFVSSQPNEIKKILIVTYAFPPAGYVGVFRTLKYCRYLPASGWSPLVLTIDPKDVAHKDSRLLEQIPPDLPIYRTFDVDPAKWIERRGQRRLERAKQANPNGAASAPPPANSQNSRRGLLRKFKDFVGMLLTDCPDSHVFWVPFALARGFRIMREHRPDVIYSTTPPHSTHYVALILGWLFRTPYVIDFRDPWETERPRASSGPIARLLASLERASKRLVVRRAAKVVCCTRGDRDDLKKEVPGLPDERFAVITNGYDPIDFAAVEPAPRTSGKLVLVHSGTIYGGIAGEFFDALRILLRQRPGVVNELEVQLVGQIGVQYADDVRELEAAGLVRAFGLQPHATALRMVQSGDIMLILLGGGIFPPSHIPAKVFEYLYSRKPILAIADPGELTEIVERSGLGAVVSPRPPEALADALLRLLERHMSGKLTTSPNVDYIRSFERTNLAKQLAGVLEEARSAV
jgi:glycosyltransferase involved in cell wall biosynthesis